MNIRPASDLKYKYSEIENLAVNEDEDEEANNPNTQYLPHEEVFDTLRGKLN